MAAYMCRFYGWTIDYVWGLPINQFLEMNKAARIIDAREFLRDVSIGDMPHLKSEKRQEVVGKVELDIKELQGQYDSVQDLAKLLKG